MNVFNRWFSRLLLVVFAAWMTTALTEPVWAEKEGAKAAEPKELTDLRKGYSKMMKSKITPLQEYYLKHLKQMMEDYTRDKKLDAALAVREEIKKMTGLLKNKEISQIPAESK